MLRGLRCVLTVLLVSGWSGAVRQTSVQLASQPEPDAESNFDEYLQRCALDEAVADVKTHKKCTPKPSFSKAADADEASEEEALHHTENVVFTVNGTSLLEQGPSCNWDRFEKRFGFEQNSSRASCAVSNQQDFQDASPCSSRNVLFLYPAHDPSNAFCLLNGDLCLRMTGWSSDASNACSVHMRRVATISQAMNALREFPDESLQHVVLGGHGSGQALSWGNGPSCHEWVDGSYSYHNNENDLCVGSRRLSEFLKLLSRKMHAHGSIFTDSCLSAKLHEQGQSLAEWVALVVRKGVRVLGSRKSFSSAQILRYGPYYAKINVSDARNVQKVYVNYTSARCPSWAETPDVYYDVLNEDGDCRCPDGKMCRTQLGGACPRTEGGLSREYFLPACSESWSDIKCECVSK